MNIIANVAVILLANSLLQVVSIDLAQEIFSMVETVMEDTDGYLPSNPHKICCGAVGCFDHGEPHDDPLLPLPGCPEYLLINMAFYSRNNPADAQVISRTIIPTNFDGSKLTIFLVHGWMGGRITNFFTAWEYVYKDLFLNIGDYNVIAVTWDIGADNPYYLQSVSNTRSVGAEISLVAQHLIDSAALDRSRLYCIGHSLGAHVCGHAGERLKFGRISGLDPAGPWYDMHSSTAGLNPNCADFVDVIHTDAIWDAAHGISFGNMRPLGHVDFYVNNAGIQPGCSLYGCSHERAIEYFQESISTPCFLVRQECADQTDMPASCVNSTNAIQSMGWISNTYEARGIFHVQTRSTRPFCLH